MTEEKKDLIITYETEHGDVTLTPGVVRDIIAKNPKVTKEEAFLFIKLCQHQQLNPFLREAYLIKYGDSPASMVVGKETFTKRAERHASFDGYEVGIYAMNDKNEIVEHEGAFYPDGETVVGAWAKVYRKDRSHPYTATVRVAEYEVHKSDGGLNKSWRERPATMIRKVALVQALREAFPDQFAGMYIVEEPQDADKISDEIKMPVPLSQTEEPEKKEDSSMPAEKVDKEELELEPDTVEDEEPTLEGVYKAIIAKVNKKKSTSVMLPYMSKANAAKDAGDLDAMIEILKGLEAENGGE
jgi:phage recombination protein Bet